MDSVSAIDDAQASSSNTCSSCNKSFAQKCHLYRHIRNVHKKAPENDVSNVNDNKIVEESQWEEQLSCQQLPRALLVMFAQICSFVRNVKFHLCQRTKGIYILADTQYKSIYVDAV